MVSAVTRWKAARESALRRVERAPRPVLRVALTFVREMTAIEPFDRAMTLAAQAFTSVFPLLITVAAFIGGGAGADVAESLPLSDSTRDVLGAALTAEAGQAAAFGAFGVLIVLLSGTSLSRALGRMYAKAWHEPHAGWGGGWRWIVVIMAISGTATATQLLNHAAHGLTQHVAALVATFLLATLLWTAVPWLLLVGRVSPGRLLPAGMLMGLGTVGLTVASRVYLPRALRIGAGHFGDLGVAFTLIGWLFSVSFVLVCATVLGAVLGRDEGVRDLVSGRGVRRLRRPPSSAASDVAAAGRREPSTVERGPGRC